MTQSQDAHALCDAYSQACSTPVPTTPVVSPASTPPALPRTGPTGGDLILTLLLATLLIAAGFALVRFAQLGRHR